MTTHARCVAIGGGMGGRTGKMQTVGWDDAKGVSVRAELSVQGYLQASTATSIADPKSKPLG